MKVREIMSTGVAKATPDNTLVDIAAMMRDKDIGSLPVVENGELKGILTDRDIVVRAIAEGQDPSTATVQEVLSQDLESVQADDDVKQAADLMASRQIRRLPVLEDGELVGMVSLGDIAVKHEEGFAAHALKGVSEGAKSASPTAAAASEESKPKRSAAKSAAGAGRASGTSKARRTRKKAA